MTKKTDDIEVLDAEVLEEITTPDFSATEVYEPPKKLPRWRKKKDWPNFNPKSRETILQLVVQGQPLKYAAGIAGVSEKTVYKWLDHGRLAQGRVEDGYADELTPLEEDFANFSLEFNRVYATPRVVLLQSAMKAARGTSGIEENKEMGIPGRKAVPPNPHLVMKLLEKLDPDEFGQRQMIDMRSKNINVDVAIEGGSIEAGEEVAKRLDSGDLRLLRANLKKQKQLPAGDVEKDSSDDET